MSIFYVFCFVMGFSIALMLNESSNRVGVAIGASTFVLSFIPFIGMYAPASDLMEALICAIAFGVSRVSIMFSCSSSRHNVIKDE